MVGRILVLIWISIFNVTAYGQTTCKEYLANGAVPRYHYQKGDQYLVLEFLYDGMTRFEMSAVKPAPGQHEQIYTSPMIARTAFPGPTFVHRNGDRYETAEQVIIVNPDNLCLSVEDKIRRVGLTTICPDNMKSEYKQLSLDPYEMRHVYGLGQYLANPGQADGDWVGRVWEPGSHGNVRREFAGGGPSNAQFPIMYALGHDGRNFGLFLDVPYKQRWDFARPAPQWWKVDMWGDEIRGYIIAGRDLPQIRERYMDLTGRPQVPPKKAFGLWVSEFGYDNWWEVDSVLQRLRDWRFPVDGFAMDLQWFGGRFNQPDTSRMGTLAWDEGAFPNPRGKIAEYRRKGVDLMLIEESYIHHTLQEHGMMAQRGYLAKDYFNGPPTFIDSNPWWGRGGLIDWSDPLAGVFWHDTKRMPLIRMGTNFHWLDLGEPEMFNPWAVYHGIAPNRHNHGDVHNVYALMWLKSISDGYARHNIRERHYSLSRAGTSGMQRFGAGMWTGDVGSNSANLAAHANVHMHMAFSGVDYLGSDAGGFFRWSLDMPLNEFYSQWYALAALIDTPLRPHAWNLDGRDRTSPAEVGHVESNLANTRLRYELSPYYYTLAHRANRHGEPVFAPPVFYYQWDARLRNMGNQMMIGRDLMMGIVAKSGEIARNVYLPRGRWFDFHSNEAFDSHGQFLDQVPVYRFGTLRLPLFARSGAIIPKMKVDAGTMNILGQRLDGGRKDDLVVRLYPDTQASSFDLIEDDGLTIDYQRGQTRTTPLWQQAEGEIRKFVVKAARGDYAGAPRDRNVIVEMVAPDSQAVEAWVNGVGISRVDTVEQFDAATGACYWNAGRNLTLIKTGKRSVYEETVVTAKLGFSAPEGALNFVCRDGHTAPGESIYVSGNIPQLGNWDPAKAIKMDALPYPTWTKIVEHIPMGTQVQWKCLKRQENGGVIQWGTGGNVQVQTLSVYPVMTEGRL